MISTISQAREAVKTNKQTKNNLKKMLQLMIYY